MHKCPALMEEVDRRTSEGKQDGPLTGALLAHVCRQSMGCIVEIRRAEEVGDGTVSVEVQSAPVA